MRGQHRRGGAACLLLPSLHDVSSRHSSIGQASHSEIRSHRVAPSVHSLGAEAVSQSGRRSDGKAHIPQRVRLLWRKADGRVSAHASRPSTGPPATGSATGVAVL